MKDSDKDPWLIYEQRAKKEVKEKEERTEQVELDWFSASGVEKPPTDLEALFSIYYTKSTDKDGNGIPLHIKLPVWEYNALTAAIHHNPKYMVGKRPSIPAAIRNALHKLIYWEAEYLNNPEAAELLMKYDAQKAMEDKQWRETQVEQARDYLDGIEAEVKKHIEENQPFMACRMLIEISKLGRTWRYDGINYWEELKEKFLSARAKFHDTWGEEWFEDTLMEYAGKKGVK